MPIPCFPTCMASLVFKCGFITPDEIKSVSSTNHIELAPAPGPGYINIVLSICMHLQFNLIPYENGSDLLVCLGDKDIFRCMTHEAVCVNGDSFISFYKPYSINYMHDEDIVNKPICIKVEDDESPFISGDSYIHFDMMYAAMPIHYWPY